MSTSFTAVISKLAHLGAFLFGSAVRGRVEVRSLFGSGLRSPPQWRRRQSGRGLSPRAGGKEWGWGGACGTGPGTFRKSEPPRAHRAVSKMTKLPSAVSACPFETLGRLLLLYACLAACRRAAASCLPVCCTIL